MMAGVQKSKINWAISLFLVMLYFYGMPTQAQYGGGTGEPNDPYLIYTAEQMNAIGANEGDWDKHFKLMADINLSAFTGTSFNIIGYYRTYQDHKPFNGVFDGNGKRISNFNYTFTERSYIGLFGYVDGFTAEIKDLGLIDPNIDAGTGSIVGSLAGSAEKGFITNCYVEGCTVSGHMVVGGLVGQNGSVWDVRNSTTITNCSSTGTVLGFQHVGGLVGDNEGGTIINCTSSASVGRTTLAGGVTPVGGLVGSSLGTIVDCYATGDVAGNDTAGGLVGENNGTITNCYATGSVLGATKIGGLVGTINYEATITNCYSTGSVLGHINIGGLVGLHWGGTITNSFWDIETSGQITSDGGTGKTTAEMQMESTFTDAGWDFVVESINGIEDIWSICEGTNYPRLAWQIPAGDFVCPDGITIEDFVFFVEHWGEDNCNPGNDYCQGTDFDFNGTVDANDFEIILDNWLQSHLIVPPQQPEPPVPPPPPGPPPKARGCFLADTPVWVNGALVQISDLVSGRMVGEPHCDPAIDCFEQIETVEEHEGTFECRDIVLESGNHISVVDAHCFMLDSGQWIAAQDLRSGLRLKTLSGIVGIKSVAIRAAPFVGKVYNLKVTGVDRYLVSEDGVIVRDY